VSPLMHAAGMWTAFAGVLNGQTVVLYDSTKFDPKRVLSTAQREKVGMMTMVGDAYAAPLVAELTDGRSIRANTALIINDARVAGLLAGAI